MPSFSSRLGSWLRRKAEPGTADTPDRTERPEPLTSAPTPAPTPSRPPADPPATAGDLVPETTTQVAATPVSPPAARHAPEPKPATHLARARVVRIGLDFGTTTTLVAVRVDEQEPRLVPIERGTDWMPSYYWRGEDGREEFGATAENLPGPVHSIKLGLPKDEATDLTYGMTPSQVSLKIISEALRRALVRLKRDRLLPAEAERLAVAANVGCSAAWDLTTRTRLRDIAAAAGLNVNLASLIEEPVAAAFAILFTGAFPGGRLLIVDIGGGTLDACVLKAEPGTNRFTIFASGGRTEFGGDKYTDLITARLSSDLAEAAGTTVDLLELSQADKTRLWQAAEQAKRDLSTRPIVRVQLPEISGTAGAVATIEREWFERESRSLVVRSMAAVNDVYRAARLILDRGNHPDDLPGTIQLRKNLMLSQIRLQDDGLDHLDRVILVGGASQTPMLRREFERIFGSRLEDPARYGLDPVEAIALGLARHEALESLDFGYPNWAISAHVSFPGGAATHDLYDPFAPVFKLGARTTSVYWVTTPLEPGATSCRLVFRRVAPGNGVQWSEVKVPAGTTGLRLDLSLLGDIKLSAVGDGPACDLYPDRPAAPWKNGQAKHPAWVPVARTGIVPVDGDAFREAAPG